MDGLIRGRLLHLIRAYRVSRASLLDSSGQMESVQMDYSRCQLDRAVNMDSFERDVD